MLKKILIITIYLIILILIVVLSQIFIVPKIMQLPFFIKYQINNKEDQKKIVIEKTEKVVVKESFSLKKTAEKVIPAMVKVYFIPNNQINYNKLHLNSQEISYSGVILSSDGGIVTILPKINLKKYQIKVLLSNNEVFTPLDVKTDSFNGLLFLKIGTDNLPVAPFGESEKMENGEKVILATRFLDNIDFSLKIVEEYSHSFSSKNLSFLFSDENCEALILDQKLDDKFTGGVAVDFKGTLIGIIQNTKQKTVLIPIKNVQEKLEDVFRENNKLPFKLGVYYINIPTDFQKINNLPVSEGALIYTPSAKTGLAVLANSVGRKIGFKIGDIILEVNQEKVSYKNNLSKILSKYKEGDDLTFKVLRGENIINLSTTK